MRTLNEVFVRHDYGTGAARVVVDVGGNIGVSAVYFLTRRPDAVVHVWEPVQANLDTLRENVAPFGDRCTVHGAALAPEGGMATFLVEPVGRYGGLADSYEHDLATTAVEVRCDAIVPALRAIMDAEGAIDLLKVDTEGSEQTLLDAIPSDLLNRIEMVAYEIHGRVVRREGAALAADRTPS